VSVVLLLAAPVATVAQGLPSGTFVGGLGAEHIVAHVLVGLALATAGLAAMVEVGNERRASGRPASRAPDSDAGNDVEPSAEPAEGASES